MVWVKRLSAAEQVADPLCAPVGRSQPLRPALARPADARLGLYLERAELVDAEAGAAGRAQEQPLFTLEVGIWRLLPRLGALEGDAALDQHLADSLVRDRLDDAGLDQMVAQLRQRPVRKRQPEVVRARERDRDDPLPRGLVDPPRPAQ